MLSDAVFLVLGAAISFFATIVFERRKRFGELLREIAASRRTDESHPLSLLDLPRAYQCAIAFWKTTERQAWTLDADGHHAAAAAVRRLSFFAFRSGEYMEHLMASDASASSKSTLLSAFQSERGRIKDADFIRFEDNIRPSTWDLLQPWPHPVATRKTIIPTVNYFEALPR